MPRIQSQTYTPRAQNVLNTLLCISIQLLPLQILHVMYPNIQLCPRCLDWSPHLEGIELVFFIGTIISLCCDGNLHRLGATLFLFSDWLVPFEYTSEINRFGDWPFIFYNPRSLHFPKFKCWKPRDTFLYSKLTII